MRATSNGRSISSEMRHILADTLGSPKKHELDLAEAIRRRFLPFDGVGDLEPHPPVAVGKPPRFGRSA